MITMELQHKGQPSNSWLRVYGEHLDDTPRGRKLAAAILDAGWKPTKYPASRLPPLDEKTMRDMATDEFCQLPGKGLFGGSTPEEGKKNIDALRRALKPLGIKLGKPRGLSMQEML